MLKQLNLGIIGLGNRGSSMITGAILGRENVTVTAVCDVYEDRTKAVAAEIKEKAGNEPLTACDYHELIALDCVDVVIIMSAWESHIPAAIESMRAGKPVGFEVGGAYSVDDCWQLVRAYEETKTPCMMLENCCFNREELMALRMVREGLFGEIVHCEGGYRHDLREEVLSGEECRHYRLRNYKNRNCENYPTHELGPIAKVLDINYGNRMISLTSTASAAFGLNAFAKETRGAEHPLSTYRFAQGDVVTTSIRCARGQTIVLTLDTSLPRWYSRAFHIQGTKGILEEDNRSILIEGSEIPFEWNNFDKYYEKYDHPMWTRFMNDGIRGGHGGIDGLEMNAFFAALREGKPMPIDVYDAAAWMVITPLSEDSIATGGAPVAIPDFTNGKWLFREKEEPWMYSLNN